MEDQALRFRALELDATVVTDRPPVADWLRGPFGSLLVAGEGRLRYEIVGTDAGVAVGFEGETIVTVPSDALAVERFCWHLNRTVVDHAGGRLLLHAGSVETAHGALVVAGASGRGKSTLTAALASRGLPYYSDETTAVDLVTGEIDPVPKPIALDRGSPMAATATTVGGSDGPGITRWLAPAALGPPARPATPTTIVLVSWRKAAGFDLRPISAGEAMLALVEHAFNVERLGRPGLEAMARLADGATAYRLTYGDLDAGVERLVDEIDLQPPRARPADHLGTHAIAVGDELAVWDRERDGLHLLNGSARHVYEQLRAGQDAEAITAHIASATGEGADVVALDVAEVVAQLTSLGLHDGGARTR